MGSVGSRSLARSRTGIGSAVLACACTSACVTDGERWHGGADAFAGGGTYSGALAPADRFATAGFRLAGRPEGRALGPEFSVAWAGGGDDLLLGLPGFQDSFDLETGEVTGGVRATFGDPDTLFEPYVGGGIAVLDAELEAVTLTGGATREDIAVGLYARGGISLNLLPRVRIGLDVRATRYDDLDLDPTAQDEQASALQVTAFLGAGL